MPGTDLQVERFLSVQDELHVMLGEGNVGPEFDRKLAQLKLAHAAAPSISSKDGNEFRLPRLEEVVAALNSARGDVLRANAAAAGRDPGKVRVIPVRQSRPHEDDLCYRGAW